MKAVESMVKGKEKCLDRQNTSYTGNLTHFEHVAPDGIVWSLINGLKWCYSSQWGVSDWDLK